jgi:hypothetical protein
MVVEARVGLSFDCVWSGGSWLSREDKSRALLAVVWWFVIGNVGWSRQRRLLKLYDCILMLLTTALSLFGPILVLMK